MSAPTPLPDGSTRHVGFSPNENYGAVIWGNSLLMRMACHDNLLAVTTAMGTLLDIRR
jgi:hypothetical protein